jgi:AcrR family transcriptional regulator
MRLYLERGFDETTVEDIASAAEISPSTFFNYFPSKEAVVFEDDLDPLILDAFNAQEPDLPPIAALRLAMREVFSQLSDAQEQMLRRRMRLLAVTPGLRAAMLNEFAILVDQIATLLASRTGRPANDFAIHNIAGALLGVLMSAMMGAIQNPGEDMVAAAVRSLEHLEAGLPLDWPGGTSR